MEKIESFKVNHLVLDRGLYVSRRDSLGGLTVTTFDMRMTAPNREPVMDMPALHTIEHLSATFLRNCARKDEVVYFGPMGCRTGCYLLMFGELVPEDVYGLVIELCDFILNFVGDIPGAKAEECGNYLEQNLNMAKYYIARYKKSLIEDKNFVYKQNF
ncbi:MAG: S-ribosylhomocysteine lyase [Clostridia bacterium]|nr:S-ribosylhomocysteine lyase [Clostridia bacterium]